MKTEPKEFSDLIKCWQSMPKNGGSAPLKTQFSPSKIRRLMPHLFLLELSSKKAINVRLMGSAVEGVLDQTASRDTVFNTLLSKDWRFYDRFMKACGGASCAGRFSRSVERLDGITVKVDSLGVPLADKNGTPRYTLGVIVTQPSSADQPITIRPVEASTPKSSHEFIDLGNGVPCYKALAEKEEAGFLRITN
mgnify:FL=1